MKTLIYYILFITTMVLLYVINAAYFDKYNEQTELKIGDSLKQLIEAYGDPDKEKEIEGKRTLIYEDKGGNSLKITLKDNKITAVEQEKTKSH